MSVAPAVIARNVVAHRGAVVALGESSFEVPDGMITVAIGPNGSGKSTLLDLVAGLIDPTDGEIEVLPTGDVPRRISYVLQTTTVNEALPITVREVVAMGRYSTVGRHGRMQETDRRAVEEAMASMRLTSLAGRHVHELSGGERQRVLVAQGLAQEHDLLLLDEPLTGLDLTSAEQIDAVVHEEPRRGCTVILTTHDLAEARAADHVLLLGGRLVASGHPGEVLTEQHLAEVYGPSQLHGAGEGLLLDDPAHQPAAVEPGLGGDPPAARGERPRRSGDG